MTEVIDRLVTAMNAHDLDAATALIHKHYRSVQPRTPGRAFVGRDQLRANWQAMFAGIPDFHAEVARSVQDGDTTWCEWHWTGTRSDGQAFEVRGVTLFEIIDGQIVSGRLYLEDVERQQPELTRRLKPSPARGRNEANTRTGDDHTTTPTRDRRRAGRKSTSRPVGVPHHYIRLRRANLPAAARPHPADPNTAGSDAAPDRRTYPRTQILTVTKSRRPESAIPRSCRVRCDRRRSRRVADREAVAVRGCGAACLAA